ncbi:MAG: hypothetical protein ACKOEC_21115 [Acidimicrobiia bacterium]
MARGEVTSIESIQAAAERRMVAALCWLLLLPPAFYLILDIAHGAGAGRLLVRAVPAMAPISGLFMIRAASSLEGQRRIFFWFGVIFACSMVASTAWRPDSEAVPLRGRLLAPTLMYMLLPNTPWRQIGPPLALCAAIAALRIARVDVAAVDFASDLSIVAALNLGGALLVVRRVTLEEALAHAWEAELKARQAAASATADLTQLQDLIPICAYCKNIRTEAGAWHQIVSYFHARAGLSFTHGICPDCRRQHFPGIGRGQSPIDPGPPQPVPEDRR